METKLQEFVENFHQFGWIDISTITEPKKTLPPEVISNTLSVMLGDACLSTYRKVGPERWPGILKNFATAFEFFGMDFRAFFDFPRVWEGMENQMGAIRLIDGIRREKYIETVMKHYKDVLAKFMAKYYKDIYLLYKKNIPLEMVSHISTFLYNNPTFSFKKSPKKQPKRSK